MALFGLDLKVPVVKELYSFGFEGRGAYGLVCAAAVPLSKLVDCLQTQQRVRSFQGPSVPARLVKSLDESYPVLHLQQSLLCPKIGYPCAFHCLDNGHKAAYLAAFEEVLYGSDPLGAPLAAKMRLKLAELLGGEIDVDVVMQALLLMLPAKEPVASIPTSSI